MSILESIRVIVKRSKSYTSRHSSAPRVGGFKITLNLTENVLALTQKHRYRGREFKVSLSENSMKIVDSWSNIAGAEARVVGLATVLKAAKDEIKAGEYKELTIDVVALEVRGHRRMYLKTLDFNYTRK